MVFKASCNQSGKVVYRVGWSLGSNTICPSDPGSIIEAAGEAHGSDVPLENVRQDCHLRVRTEAVLSLGCYHCAERELGLLVSNSEPQAPSQPGPLLRATLLSEAFPENPPSFPFIFQRCHTFSCSPYPLSPTGISLIYHLHS